MSNAETQKRWRERHPEKAAYFQARQRCRRPLPQNRTWWNYGGRGIEFRFESFEQFYAVLGPRPSPTHSVDRIDVEGHYEPGNVRWATRSEQALNRRRSKSHNVDMGPPEHDPELGPASRYARTTESHNIYSRKGKGLDPVPVRSSLPSTSSRRGGGNDVLRKRSVQPAAGGAQPLDVAVRLAPAPFDGLGLGFRHLGGQVQRPAIAEMDTRPGHEPILRGDARA